MRPIVAVVAALGLATLAGAAGVVPVRAGSAWGAHETPHPDGGALARWPRPVSAHGVAGPEFHGVNAQDVFRMAPESWDAPLAALAATGIRIVRKDAFWSDAEPRPPVDGVHTYRWDRHDRIAAALARHGLRWYALIDYGTPWATSVTGPRAWMAPPDDPAHFAAYASAFAARYGPDGSFWLEHPELTYLPVRDYEIWNEPNVERFWPDQATAAERYADLFVLASRAIRSVDADARIATGGLSSVGVADFLTRMTVRQPTLLAEADAIAFHPYGGLPEMTYARIATLRQALVDVGAPHTPIEITETGWAAPPRPEETRAAQIRRLAVELPSTDCGITRLIVYAWTGLELDAANPEHWFGLASPDGTLKPSGAAYVDGVAEARAGAAEVLDIC